MGHELNRKLEKCSNCGEYNIGYAMICSHCGHTIKEYHSIFIED